MSIIKPTVGRKVWYRPSKSDLHGPVPMTVAGSVHAGTAQPLDATVLAVWGDRCINVQVLDITGKAFTKMSVTLKQEGDTMPVDTEGEELLGYCEWMPYQQGQAKKDSGGAA
jgi:hypothetical protein